MRGTAAQTALLIFTSKITKTKKNNIQTPPKKKVQNVENEIQVKVNKINKPI